jgi:sugar lactone lactonase YvrE
MALSAWHNHSVMLIDPVMSRIAGTGKAGYDSVETAANATPVNLPSASVYTSAGDLIFSDQANGILRRIGIDGVIHRFAGQAPVWNGTHYVPQRGFAGDGGPALDATFKWDATTTCGKLAIDATGRIYVCDTLNHAVRMIDTSGIIHRFAGQYPASAGFSGDGGPAVSAQLKKPRDVACDANGNVFIADTGNLVIRMVAPNGIITTVAGTPGVIGDSKEDGKLATEATLNFPYGIAIDPQGNLWIADTYNSRIRVVYR